MAQEGIKGVRFPISRAFKAFSKHIKEKMPEKSGFFVLASLFGAGIMPFWNFLLVFPLSMLPTKRPD